MDSLLFFHFPFNCVLVLLSGELMLFYFSSIFELLDRVPNMFFFFIFPSILFFHFRLVWMSCTCIHVLSAPYTYVFTVFENTLVPLHRKARKQRWKLCSCSVKIKTMKNRNDEDADDARYVWCMMLVRDSKRKHIVTKFFFLFLIWFKITSHR